MKKGRRPKPTAIKLIAGNPGKRPLNRNEPVYPGLNIQNPPDDLCEDGKAIWLTIGSQLSDMGVLQTVDRNIFYRYCDVYAKWMRIVKFLEEQVGPDNPSGIRYAVEEQKFIQTERGNWIPEFDSNGSPVMQVAQYRVLPEVAEYRRLGDALLKLEGELGLSPSARSRVSSPKFNTHISDDDPFG